MLRECIEYAAASFVLPGFDDTGSLGYPPRLEVYPLGSTLGDCLMFLGGE